MKAGPLGKVCSDLSQRLVPGGSFKDANSHLLSLDPFHHYSFKCYSFFFRTPGTHTVKSRSKAKTHPSEYQSKKDTPGGDTAHVTRRDGSAT